MPSNTAIPVISLSGEKFNIDPVSFNTISFVFAIISYSTIILILGEYTNAYALSVSVSVTLPTQCASVKL